MSASKDNTEKTSSDAKEYQGHFVRHQTKNMGNKVFLSRATNEVFLGYIILLSVSFPLPPSPLPPA